MAGRRDGPDESDELGSQTALGAFSAGDLARYRRRIDQAQRLALQRAQAQDLARLRRGDPAAARQWLREEWLPYHPEMAPLADALIDGLVNTGHYVFTLPHDPTDGGRTTHGEITWNRRYTPMIVKFVGKSGQRDGLG